MNANRNKIYGTELCHLLDTALDEAVCQGEGDIVALLLQAGADPQVALERTGDSGDLNIAWLALAFGADPQANDKEVFKRAAEQGNADLAARLRAYAAN
ncbi:MAG: hypothetical protein ACYDBH_11000 [Acidobacteriaceae bacterium]